jgi:hypothetical protein
MGDDLPCQNMTCGSTEPDTDSCLNLMYILIVIYGTVMTKIHRLNVIEGIPWGTQPATAILTWLNMRNVLRTGLGIGS